jgi:hypothetical protein
MTPRDSAELREPRRQSAHAIVVWFAVVMGIVALGVLLLWLVPLLLTATPRTGVSPAERLTARNDARTPVIAFAVAIGTAMGLWYTHKTYLTSRDQQITDRYSHAVDQLANEKPAAHIGGIYALEAHSARFTARSANHRVRAGRVHSSEYLRGEQKRAVRRGLRGATGCFAISPSRSRARREGAAESWRCPLGERPLSPCRP